jgi:hypothetical protein
LTHLRQRRRSSAVPISHWTTVRFCNGCPAGIQAGMSQGLRVLVLHVHLLTEPVSANSIEHLPVAHSQPPSRPKTLSIPSLRSKVCARRSRPVSGRGLFGQPARSAPICKRSMRFRPLRSVDPADRAMLLHGSFRGRCREAWRDEPGRDGTLKHVD